MNLGDVSLRLGLLGETQEALQAPSLIIHSVVVATVANHLGEVTVVLLSLLVHLFEVEGQIGGHSVFAATHLCQVQVPQLILVVIP